MSKKCTLLWREAHFEVKMYKTHHSRTTFGSCDVEKVHAVVARSTFWSQNVQSTPFSDHFWKLRCRKSARRCGAKHILKSKMYKAHHSRTTFESWDVWKVHAVVARSTFWSRNVQDTPGPDHFWKLRCRKSARRCGAKQVKMCKTPHVRATFGGSDVEKVHAVVARSTFRSQHVQNTTCSRHFLEVQMSKKCTPLWREAHFEVKMLKTPGVRTTFGGSDVASLHYTTLHYTTLHYTTLHYTTLHYTTLQLQLHNYTPLHSTTLNYTTIHYITLHYTPLHYTTLHYTALPSTTLHYITLHSTTLQLQLHNYTPLQYTPLHSTTLNYTTLHYITLHSTTLHYTTLHYTTFHYTSLHYTTLHSTTLQLQLRLHNYTPLHEITLRYITLHYTTLHYTPLHYTTLHYTTIHWMTLHRR